MNAQASHALSGASNETAHRARVTLALLVLVLLLALGLRLYRLDAQSLWNDEGTSVAVAQRDPATILRDAANDIHPPIYYLLLSAWTRALGTSESAVRLLSALLGVLLVAITFALGRTLAGPWLGLVAAFLAAVNPFQVYYSQEARMYMLAAVLAAAAVWALVRYTQSNAWPYLLAVALIEAAGLYTHYSFVFVLLCINLAFLATLRRGTWPQRLGPWVLSQLAAVIVYLPWLPTAIRQATGWPRPEHETGFLSALAETWRWLLFGPTIETGQVTLPLILAAILVLLGIVGLAVRWMHRLKSPGSWIALLLSTWLSLPVLLMLVLGLYRDAYLKFLLVTSPALCLLLAVGLCLRPARCIPAFPSPKPYGRYPVLLLQAVAFMAILAGTAISLTNYYADPAYARDNYRDIAAYIDAVGRQGDAVLLNAPGQREVFDYYYRGELPVGGLPETRPPDQPATEAALARLGQPGGRIFALLWATGESDPQRIVEDWLDTHAFKALDSWYGNVRLVTYAVPDTAGAAPGRELDIPLQDSESGEFVTLLGYSLLTPRLAAGDIAQVVLHWQALQTPSRRYKVFLHLLDAADHIVGQRDAEPGGGALPTTHWEPGENIADNHGVPVHPATPPGAYRLRAGMYDAETGQRLTTVDGLDQVDLGALEVDRPPAPPPVAALGIQHRERVPFGDLTLLGYDIHRLGFDHQPEAPIAPGQVLHTNLYWRAEDAPRGDWSVAIELLDRDGRSWAAVAGEAAGGYPTSQWMPGDIWRGQFDLVVPPDAPKGPFRLRIQAIDGDGTQHEAFETETVRVE